MNSLPWPEITNLNRPYWEGISQGSLLFQRCAACANSWLPARNACPACLDCDVGWEASKGQGVIVSWVIYHVPYHEAFKDRIPYDVILVELDEGPRLLSNLSRSSSSRGLKIGARVHLAIELEEGRPLARFRLER